MRLLRRLDYLLQGVRQRDRETYLRSQIMSDPTASFGDEASVNNSQTDAKAILIGAHCSIHGQLLVYRHGGQIKLGSYVFLGPGSRVWSAASVIIGNHVLISHSVNIHDSDSHPIDAQVRREQMKFILNRQSLPDSSFGVLEAPVFIGDDAWIGMNAVILKGVSIGQGAIVAAGSVVTRNVEAFTLVAGNPATPRKKLT